MVKHTQTIRVFEHFVGLALKGLISLRYIRTWKEGLNLFLFFHHTNLCTTLKIKTNWQKRHQNEVNSGVFIVYFERIQQNILHINVIFLFTTLTLSWQRFISYRNQPNDLSWKSPWKSWTFLNVEILENAFWY